MPPPREISVLGHRIAFYEKDEGPLLAETRIDKP